MAHVFLMLRACFVAFVLLVSSHVNAAFEMTPVTAFQYCLSAGCGVHAGTFNASNGFCGGSELCVSQIQCNTAPTGNGITCARITSDPPQNLPAYAIKQCPAGYSATASGLTGWGYLNVCFKTVTTCPAGSTLIGTVCENRCTSQAAIGSPGFIPSTSGGTVSCSNGCKAFFGSDAGYCPSHRIMVKGTMQNYCKGQWFYAGNGAADVCTPGTEGVAGTSTATPKQPDPSCSAGQAIFWVNNNPGCVTQSTGQVATQPPTKTTTNTTTTNADGSKTVTSTTVDSGTGQTSTSSTTYGSGVTVPVIPSTVTEPSDYGKGTGQGTASGTSKEGEGDKDLCEDDPERIACKKLEEPPAEEPITESTVNFNITPSTGFGSVSYSCPVSSTFTIGLTGPTVAAFDYAPMCQFAEGVRPVILAFAFLAATLIALGGKGE